MKIRTDFVTNSSSSSFILARTSELNEKQKEEIQLRRKAEPASDIEKNVLYSADIPSAEFFNKKTCNTTFRCSRFIK